MSGTIPPLPQYAFMAWYLVKAQGQLYPFFFQSVDTPSLCGNFSYLRVVSVV